MNTELFAVGVFGICLGIGFIRLFSKLKIKGQVGFKNFIIKGSLTFVLVIGGLGLMAYSTIMP